jgi:hypothetical protein
MCFIRRVLLHVTSCVGDANSFLSVLSGLAETCGLSKRDVSQCAGPFDQVLSRLKSIQSAASAGDFTTHKLFTNLRRFAALTQR